MIRNGRSHTIVTITLMLFMIVLVVGGCPSTPVVVTGNIASPSERSSSDPLVKQYFQANLNEDSAKVQWRSSVQGKVGEYNHMWNYLIPGDHTIDLLNKQGDILDTMNITIDPYTFVAGKTIYRPTYLSPGDWNLPAGNYATFAVTTPLVTNQPYAVLEVETPATDDIGQIDIEPNEDRIVRSCTDLGLDYLINDPEARLITSRAFLGADTKNRSIGDTTTFKMYSFEEQGQYYSIPATLFHDGSYFQIWIDNNDYPDYFEPNTDLNDDLRAFILDSETHVINRVVDSIVGEHYDLDNSGNFTVLLSSKLNQSGAAIGFFNAIDYFDSSSSAYAMSNELDIIYMGVPDRNNPNFAPKSLAATLGHEFTHMVIFSQKTYLPRIEGITKQFTFEEDFLDEGIAHLMETLVGYGESGGNLLFLKSYFIRPERFSLSGKNTAGAAEDNQARRGGVLALLWWLFDREGGVEWGSNGAITDKGGVSFVKRLLQPPYVGWNSIIKASSEFSTVEELLATYASEYALMNSSITTRTNNAPPVTRHPLTDEITSMHPFVGTFWYGDRERNLSKIFSENIDNIFQAYPYTVIWGKVYNDITPEDRFYLGGKIEGVSFGFTMLESTP